MPLNNDGADPVFPPELERDIFEITARSNRGTAVKLALVSRRVHSWMESYLYETVTLSTIEICKLFLYTTSVRSPSFFTATVKSLCIPGDIPSEDALRILTVCQGVVNLAYWISTISQPNNPHFHVISSLRPKRLSINTGCLFGSALPDFTDPFFSQVTHLEVVDWPWAPDPATFGRLPSLTHLAINLGGLLEDDLDPIPKIFRFCPRLHVLLCLVDDDVTMINAWSVLSPLDADVNGRLVISADSDSESLENWENSVNENADNQWAFAERLVAAKQSQTPQGL